MSNYTPTNYKAIGWFAEQNNCIPQLSSWPNVRFMVKGTEEIIVREITGLTFEYLNAHREEQKEKARARKAEKAKDDNRRVK